MTVKYREAAPMKSTLLSLALCIAPLVACSVDTGGLANADGAGGAGGVRTGGNGGTGTMVGTGATAGQGTGGAITTDAAGPAPDSGTADGLAGERPGGTGGAAGRDARADLRPTGGAGGTGGIIGVDGGAGGVVGSDGGDDGRADGGPGPDLSRDTGDAQTRDLAREGAPDRAPDVPLPADGPSADLADAAADAQGASDTHGEAGPALALVWHDEFDGAANTGVETSRWTYVTWQPGMVNDELQQYTSNLRNVFQDGDGHLVIRALNDSGGRHPYTSGRIETTGKISFGPGHRIEVRAKLPAGSGSFPAILLKGTTGLWPESGALGLMEQYGQDKSWFYATAYAPNTPGSGVTPKTKHSFADATTASADFHVYALDWYDDHLVFQVDGAVILTSNYGPTSPFYSITEFLVLNVALGGDMGGAIDDDAFPMDMVIDYVRVYQF